MYPALYYNRCNFSGPPWQRNSSMADSDDDGSAVPDNDSGEEGGADGDISDFEVDEAAEAARRPRGRPKKGTDCTAAEARSQFGQSARRARRSRRVVTEGSPRQGVKIPQEGAATLGGAGRGAAEHAEAEAADT